MQDLLQNYLIETALNAHNNYRLLHGAPSLKHNPELSKIAFCWASNLVNTKTLEYSKNKYNNANLGENLLASTRSVNQDKIDGNFY